MAMLHAPPARMQSNSPPPRGAQEHPAGGGFFCVRKHGGPGPGSPTAPRRCPVLTQMRPPWQPLRGGLPRGAHMESYSFSSLGRRLAARAPSPPGKQSCSRAAAPPSTARREAASSPASRSASPDKARTWPSLLGRSGTTTMPSGACSKWARVRLSWHEQEAAQVLRGSCFPARIPVEGEGGEGWDLNSRTHRRA